MVQEMDHKQVSNQETVEFQRVMQTLEIPKLREEKEWLWAVTALDKGREEHSKVA